MANDRLELCENTAGDRGENQTMSKTKGGSTRKYTQSSTIAEFLSNLSLQMERGPSIFMLF